MCFVGVAHLERRRRSFGIGLGAVPLGSRSGAVRAGFGGLCLERVILAMLFDRSPALWSWRAGVGFPHLGRVFCRKWKPIEVRVSFQSLAVDS